MFLFVATVSFGMNLNLYKESINTPLIQLEEFKYLMISIFFKT